MANNTSFTLTQHIFVCMVKNKQVPCHGMQATNQQVAETAKSPKVPISHAELISIVICVIYRRNNFVSIKKNIFQEKQCIP